MDTNKVGNLHCHLKEKYGLESIKLLSKLGKYNQENGGLSKS